MRTLTLILILALAALPITAAEPPAKAPEKPKFTPIVVNGENYRLCHAAILLLK